MTITSSPWGVPDSAEELVDNVTGKGTGIYFVSTPSHGGYFVPPALNSRVPAHWRDITFNRGQGNAGWYEEDADWALVALCFPECFIPEERSIARRICQQTHERKLYPGAFDAAA